MDKEFQISETSKKQDKKYFKSFVVIMICSMIGGGVGGATMSQWMDYAAEHDVYRMLGDIQLSMVSIFRCATVVLGIAFLLVLSVIYFGVKKEVHKIDDEDDALYKKVEKNIGRGLAISNVGYLLGILTFGVGSYCMPKTSGDGTELFFTMNVLFFLVILVAMIFYQNRFVNLYKELSPEKQVSTYDMKFRKRWLENCDEAEKMMIYQASYKVFCIMNNVYTWTAVILVIISMGFEIGIFPFITVMLLWLTSQIIYFIASSSPSN